MEVFDGGPPFFGGMGPQGIPDMNMFPGVFPPGFEDFNEQQPWKRPRMEGGGGMEVPPMGMDPMAPNFALNAPPKQKSIFWKTRLCIKWRQGQCHHGDVCNFAHGDHELRVLPPELLAQLEQNKMTKQSQQQLQDRPASAAADNPPPEQRKEEGGAGADGKGELGNDSKSSLREIFFKTRLCNKFMQFGFCPYGPKCIFAHGHEDLRAPPDFLEGGAPPPGPAPPGGPGPVPPPKPPPVIPGKMVPPPRPPPGPPPPHLQPMPRSLEGDTPPSASGGPPAAQVADVPYIERVKTICALLAVGKLSPADNTQTNLHAAAMSIRTGQAFRENPYADGIEIYIR